MTETAAQIKVNLEIANCMNCPFHEVQPDPDPHDWFNDDDEKVLCKKADKYITTACRPHHKRNECKVPQWCPLIKNNNNGNT